MSYSQNFMACGASFFVRENLAPRYFFTNLSFMFFKRGPSTAFCKSFLATDKVFFGAFSAKNLCDLVCFALTSFANVSSVILEASTPARSILVLVVKVYDWLTLFTGTPLSLNGPVTARRPDFSYLRTTTLFPLNLPAKSIRTLPGSTPFLILGALGLCLFGVDATSSAGYQASYFYFLTIFTF